MAYRYTEYGSIIRESDGASIPPDPNNMDYRGLMWALALKQIEIAPYVPPEKIARTQLSLEEILNVLVKKGIITSEEVSAELQATEGKR